VYRPVILVKEENVMETAIVSPDFQVALPPAIREALGIQPGQSVQVILYQSRIELLPLRAISEMRGFLKGIDTTVEREPDRT
jgi:AbrB family looped-hinge helix DNA binding protein